MRNAIVFSVFLHTAVLVVGYFGLPYIQSEPLLTDTPIVVEIVNVADITNAPPPAPEPEKKPKPEAKKEEPPAPPPPPPKASPPPPTPHEKEEVAVLPPEPKPEAKPKPEPKPKPKVEPKVEKPKPVRKLAKVRPRHKPRPPDAFASVLKTVEKLKNRPKPKDKKEDKKEDKKKKKKEEKTQSFEDRMAKALASQTAMNNPLRPMAISEIDMVRRQIRECWSLPAGAMEAENLSIEIKMAMNPDGTVRQARILDQGRLQTDPFFRAAAESALRAVLNPRCNPLKLPPEKYQQWQNMILIFDPRQMF